MLVRAIADFPAPTLTGIGHDKDAPLVAMVSDMNVSTPTAVANLLNASWNDALSSVRLSEEKILSQFGSAVQSSQYILENSEVIIENRFDALLATFRRAEQTLVSAVNRIESGILRVSERIVQEEKDLLRGFALLSARVGILLNQSEKSMLLASPEKQLARGYSIVRHNGKVLRSIKDAKKKDILDITLSDGTIPSEIL